MDLKIFLSAFATVFLAEMGDKTQLAAITMTASTGKPWAVFAGAALALVVVTALGVLFGQLAAKFVPELVLRRGAAACLVLMGVWIWFRV